MQLKSSKMKGILCYNVIVMNKTYIHYFSTVFIYVFINGVFSNAIVKNYVFLLVSSLLHYYGSGLKSYFIEVSGVGFETG